MASTAVLLLGVYPFLEIILGRSSSTDPLQDGRAHSVLAHLHALFPILLVAALLWRVSVDGLSSLTLLAVLSVGLYLK